MTLTLTLTLFCPRAKQVVSGLSALCIMKSTIEIASTCKYITILNNIKLIFVEIPQYANMYI